MMISFFTAVFLLIFLLILYDLYNREHFDYYIGAVVATKFTMGVYYGIVPGLILIFRNYYEVNAKKPGFSDINRFIIKQNDRSYLVAFVCIAIGYLVIKSASDHFFIKNNRVCLNYNHESFKQSFDNAICLISYITFVIGCLSIMIYVLGVGGIWRALNLAEVLRGFSENPADYMPRYIALFRVPARLIHTSSLFFLYQLLSDSKITKRNVLMFVLSTILTVFVLLLNAGRAPLVQFAFLLVFPFLRKRIKHLWLILLCLGVIFLPILVVLDDLFVSLSTLDFSTTLELVNFETYLNLLPQFSHPIKILLNVENIVGKYDYLYYRNIVTDLFSILPNVSFEQSFFNTSEYFRGPNWRSLGGIPNDLLSYGYLNLGFIGVVLSASWCGLLGAWLDKLTNKLEGIQRHYVGAILAVNFFGIVINADLLPNIFGGFDLILLSLAYIYARISERTELCRSK